LISTPAQFGFSTTDCAVLFLRVGASLVPIIGHGLPKLPHYASEEASFEAPFHFAKAPTICFAIFAEVVCPLFVIADLATRIAALPVSSRSSRNFRSSPNRSFQTRALLERSSTSI
jgi:putative oxidoreductase